MEIKVIRFSPQVDSTSGIMLIDNEFVAYTLEDEERDEKVYGETCIPAGKYEIKYRKVGGFHTRYSERFKNIVKCLYLTWQISLACVCGFIKPKYVVAVPGTLTSKSPKEALLAAPIGFNCSVSLPAVALCLWP